MINLDDRLEWIRGAISIGLARRGAVVQTSGGVDSAVTLKLCSEALGPDKVYALFLPDAATDPESEECARLAAQHAGVQLNTEVIDSVTSARDEAYTSVVRKYYPDFDPSRHGSSINVDARMLKETGLPLYRLAVGPRHGEPTSWHRLRTSDLRNIIAIQNRKQRYRMLCAYEVAERMAYSVVGASNREELDSGFVVKYGDDAADICAIGDLSKSEVYELASQLDIPLAISARTPTTDTYTLRQSQDEYFYGGQQGADPHPAEALSGRNAHLRYLSIRSARVTDKRNGANP